MDYKEYKEHRKKALEIYGFLKEYLDKEKIDYSFLEKREKNLIENKFLLAVVGEVKAGKSTFINALLGKKILPSGVLQATSAIIQIFKSDEEFVRVLFGDGHEERVVDDLSTPDVDEAVEYLEKMAAISEEIRQLPIVQLNDFLVKKYNSEKKEAEYSDDDLNEFFEINSKDYNIHGLPEEEFKKQCTEYIDKNKSLSKVPVEVYIGYPLEWEFDSMILVDTPGVNASGGIESKTYDFIEEANAIIYLHNIPPVESKSFRDFIDNTLTNRQQECLMLVLSHISELGEEETEKSFSEAKKLFNKIKSENIFAVDSLTELYRKSFYTCSSGKFTRKEYSEIKEDREKDKELRKFTASIWEESRDEKDVFDIDKFYELMEKQANFRELRERLETFSAEAGCKQIKEFLAQTSGKFKELESDINVRLEAKNLKLKSPQFFAAQKKANEGEIEKLKSDKNDFIHNISSKYNVNAVGCDFYEKIKESVDLFKGQINGRRFGGDDTKKTVEEYSSKILNEFKDEVKKIVEEIEKGIINDIKLEDSENLKKVNKVNIPVVNLYEIWDKAKSRAYSKKTVVEKIEEEGLWGKVKRFFHLGGIEERIKEISYFDAPKYWEIVQGEVCNQVQIKNDNFKNDIKKYVDSFCDLYKKDINKKVDKMKERYNEIEKEAQTNAELENEIKMLKGELKEIRKKISECERIEASL